MNISEIERLPELITWLKNIIEGDDNATVTTDTGQQPSIQKAIADKLEYLKTLVQVSLSFGSKSEMDADTGQSVNTLAWVWNDPVVGLNGLYGWTGTQWAISNLDKTQELTTNLQALEYITPISAYARLASGGLGEYQAADNETLIPLYISEDTNQCLIGIDKQSGQVIMDIHDSNPMYGTISTLADALESLGYSAPVDALSRLPNLRDYVENEQDEIKPVITSDAGQSLLGFYPDGQAALDVYPNNLARSLEKLKDADYDLTYVPPESHSEDLLFAVVDSAPRPQILAAVDNRGNWMFSGQNNHFNVNLLDRPVMYHIVQDGQSQSTGGAAIPPLTLSQSANNYPLMASGGLTTVLHFDSLVPLIEETGESPAAAMAEGLYKSLNAQGIDTEAARFKFGFSNPGQGGTTIDQYVGDGIYTSRFYDQIKGMQSAAYSAGLDYQLHAFTWTLGGSDMSILNTSYDSYLSQLLQLRQDRETTAREVLGRPGLELHCIVWQNGARVNGETLDVPNAQVAAAKQDDFIHLACAYYQLEYTDTVHPTNVGSKHLGYYLQRVYKTVVIDEKRWHPLWPTTIKANARTITASFEIPVPPLMFDTALLKTIEHQGFVVNDDVGEAGIVSVEIINGAQVQIVVDRDLGANPVLSYAERYTEAGDASLGDHPRGLLHDSAGLTDIYEEPKALDSEGRPRVFPLHNWCITFNKSILIEE